MGLFPSPAARYRLWSESWKSELDKFELEHRGNHSYSLDTSVLDSLPQLKAAIERDLNDFAQSVLGIAETIYITQSWINLYQQGDSIHQHNHPNSIISGTWYWDTPDTEILFHKQGLNSATTWTMKLDQQVAPDRPFAVQTNSIRVEETDLVFWPSYLQHSVPPHADETPRRTLSFNSMPKTWGSDLYRVV